MITPQLTRSDVVTLHPVSKTTAKATMLEAFRRSPTNQRVTSLWVPLSVMYSLNHEVELGGKQGMSLLQYDINFGKQTKNRLKTHLLKS